MRKTYWIRKHVSAWQSRSRPCSQSEKFRVINMPFGVHQGQHPGRWRHLNFSGAKDTHKSVALAPKRCMKATAVQVAGADFRAHRSWAVLCSSLQAAEERRRANKAGGKLPEVHTCLHLLGLAGTERRQKQCPAAVFVCCWDASMPTQWAGVFPSYSECTIQEKTPYLNDKLKSSLHIQLQPLPQTVLCLLEILLALHLVTKCYE